MWSLHSKQGSFWTKAASSQKPTLITPQLAETSAYHKDSQRLPPGSLWEHQGVFVRGQECLGSPPGRSRPGLGQRGLAEHAGEDNSAGGDPQLPPPLSSL